MHRRAQGYELTELDSELAEANAAADPDGRLALARVSFAAMIYSVVPRELEATLFEQLAARYAAIPR